MASKKSKQTNFFGGNRRELTLQEYRTLMSRGEEKRMKLFVRMPLTNKPAVGIPKWVSSPYLEMAKEDSLTGRVNIPDVFHEGMTLQIYSTDKVKRKTLTATGCMLIGFHLDAQGDGESREVFLCFTVYCPANIQLRDWAWDHLHKTFFADFEYSQTEMDFDGEQETDGDEDEPVEEEEDEEVMA
jgi:hypothetical protein